MAPLGRATGPPQPEAHPGDPSSSFGHNTVSLPRLAPAQSLQSSNSRYPQIRQPLQCNEPKRSKIC